MVMRNKTISNARHPHIKPFAFIIGSFFDHKRTRLPAICISHPNASSSGEYHHPNNASSVKTTPQIASLSRVLSWPSIKAVPMYMVPTAARRTVITSRPRAYTRLKIIMAGMRAARIPRIKAENDFIAIIRLNEFRSVI